MFHCYFRKTCILVSILLLLRCNSEKSSDQNTFTLPDSANVSLKKENPIIDTLGKLFDNKAEFKVQSAAKAFTSYNFTGFEKSDSLTCDQWILTQSQIIRLIKNSVNIDGTTWDLAFGNSVCTYQGILRQQSENFKFEINGGSWFAITCKDTTLLFGNFKNKDKRLFLIPFSD